MDIDITIDTREKRPLEFKVEKKAKSGWLTRVNSVSVGTLHTGDYSITSPDADLTNLVIVERKFGFAELFVNLSNKENRDRFYNEMERMRPFVFKYILVETVLTEDVMKLGVPQMKWGPPGSKILRELVEIQMDFNVNFIFSGDATERLTRTIFESAVKWFKKQS
jgi:ERCC4-type nuclease